MGTTIRTLPLLLLSGVLILIAEPALAKKQRPPRGTVVKWKEVPAVVQATVQTSVAGGKVKEVRQDTANGLLFYCAEIKGADGKWEKIYVKDTGTLIRVEPDNARNKRKHKPLFGG